MTVMDFSGIYRAYTWKALSRCPDFRASPVLDFRELPGTCGYCDAPASSHIRERIAKLPAEGIHFLDNGNYHYASLFWTEKIQEDFALLVYDHHADLLPPRFEGLLSCGSWIRPVLEGNAHCRAVLLLGISAEQEALCHAQYPEKACQRPEGTCGQAGVSVPLLCIPEEQIHSRRHFGCAVPVSEEHGSDPPVPSLLEEAFSDLFPDRSLPLYLSIDKDVLSEEACRSSWDQGTLAAETLFQSLEAFSACRWIGMDICGEPPEDASLEDFRKSAEINERLVQIYRASARS